MPTRASAMNRTLLLVLLATPTATAAQAPLKAAAATITPADISRRIHIIADDSMQGRDTPSPGLEKTAQYVADEFRKVGLKPGGENGTWFQRYSISRRRVDIGNSHVGFMIGGQHAHVTLERDARFAFGAVPASEQMGGAVVLGGAFGAKDVEGVDFTGKAILVVMDYSKPLTPAVQQTLAGLIERHPTGVILLSNRDSSTFAQRVRSQAGVRQVVGAAEAGSPIVEVHERAIPSVIQEAGLDLAAIRASSEPVVRPLPALTIAFDVREEVLESKSAPNTIGILEGTDPRLKNEYVVFSAHMDHVGVAGPNGTGGCTAKGADSICNGADDDGSGTVSVMELAEAFTRKGVRPKRSIIFMTVSGEEKGLWGSEYFSNHPTVPLDRIVADLNIDMVGRNWKDSVVAIGKEHSDLGATLNRVGGMHPELRMQPIDDIWPNENFYFRSDHYNFARKGVPILFFFTGTHEDYHQVSDSPDKIDTEKMTRIVQLLFYLGQEVANAPDRPKWNPDSYAKIVEGRPST